MFFLKNLKPIIATEKEKNQIRVKPSKFSRALENLNVLLRYTI